MESSDTRYAQSGDVHVAYRVFGAAYPERVFALVEVEPRPGQLTSTPLSLAPKPGNRHTEAKSSRQR